jgi:hypothetical protein
LEAHTQTPPHLIDDVEADSAAELVLEPASPLAEVDRAAKPILITEQEVVLSTAAAVQAQHSQPKRRHHPPRATYLEYSRMQREMHRL